MNSDNYNIIDVHGHYGQYLALDKSEDECAMMTGNLSQVRTLARQAGIKWTIVSPLAGLLPRGIGDAYSANRTAFSEVGKYEEIFQYVIVDPRDPRTYEQAIEMLDSDKCIGIKVHPEEHCYAIKKMGPQLFKELSQFGFPVLAHAGCQRSLPMDYIDLIEMYPEITLILAHIGNGAGDKGRLDLHIEALKVSEGANVYADTSSSKSILGGIIEWAVDSVGSERILFGSDTPLYSAGAQAGRILGSTCNDSDKENILYKNAERIFKF